MARVVRSTSGVQLNQLLERAKKTHKKTHKQFAIDAGLSESAISEFIHDKHKLHPQKETVGKILDALIALGIGIRDEWEALVIAAGFDLGEFPWPPPPVSPGLPEDNLLADLPTQPVYMADTTQIASTLIRLVRAANSRAYEVEQSRLASAGSNASPQILVTYIGETVIHTNPGGHIPAAEGRIRDEWWAALASALSSKWTLEHFVRFDQFSEKEGSQYIERMFPLFGLGDYHPHHIQLPYIQPQRNKDRRDLPTYNAVYVPSVGAAIILPTGHYGPSFLALYYPFNATASTTAPFDGLLSYLKDHWGNWFFESYSSQSMEFLTRLAEYETWSSGRRLIMSGLSEVTVPKEVTAARRKAIKAKEGDADADMVVELRHRRYEAFRTNLRHQECVDICTQDAVNAFVRFGIYPKDDWFSNHEAGNATYGQRKAQLLEVIDLLNNRRQYQQNYHLGLMSERETSSVEYLKHTFVYLKSKPGAESGGDGVVLIEARPDDPKGVNLHSTDPIAVAFAETHFKTMRDDKATELADRDAVTRWLQRHIKLIDEAIQSDPFGEDGLGEVSLDRFNDEK